MMADKPKTVLAILSNGYKYTIEKQEGNLFVYSTVEKIGHLYKPGDLLYDFWKKKYDYEGYLV